MPPTEVASEDMAPKGTMTAPKDNNSAFEHLTARATTPISRPIPGVRCLVLRAASPYGPYFDGQTGSDPFSAPAFVTGTPNHPVALTAYVDPATGMPDWQTIIEADINTNTQVIGGLPSPATNGFGGPIAILFSTPVRGVVLTAGDFDTIGTTAIEAFTGIGSPIGSVTNTAMGYETFNLSDNGGQLIGGLLLTSTDPAGFAIDGVGVNQITAAPAPGLLSVLPAYAVLLLLRRRSRAGGPGS